MSAKLSAKPNLSVALCYRGYRPTKNDTTVRSKFQPIYDRCSQNGFSVYSGITDSDGTDNLEDSRLNIKLEFRSTDY